MRNLANINWKPKGWPLVGFSRWHSIYRQNNQINQLTNQNSNTFFFFFCIQECRNVVPWIDGSILTVIPATYCLHVVLLLHPRAEPMPDLHKPEAYSRNPSLLAQEESKMTCGIPAPSLWPAAEARPEHQLKESWLSSSLTILWCLVSSGQRQACHQGMQRNRERQTQY